MASVSSAHLIMFIGSLLIATAVAGTVVVEVGSMSEAIEVRGSSVAEDIETDIVIISDESQSESIVDDGNVTVLVKNVGSRGIPAESGEIDVIADGKHTVPSEVRLVNDDGDEWEPGAVAELTVETDESFDGDTTIVVIVGSNEDSIMTYVGDVEGEE